MGALATDVETAAVADMLKRYIEAVEERDLVKYATVVAHDDDLAWYGSMPGQIVGWADTADSGRHGFLFDQAQMVDLGLLPGTQYSEAGAIKALARAAQMTSGLKPVEAITRDLYKRPYVPIELKGFDAAVFDPPRQGAETQARELAKSGIKTIVGVSCNPTTFARDARILVDGGYKLARVTAVDQFRWSHHVEVVGKFER
jgi:probable HAF family extracellular repeat protein